MKQNSYKKQILFVNGHLNVGGVEKSLVDLLRALDYSKYDVDLLLLESKGVYLEKLPHEVNIIYHNPTHIYGPAFHTLFWNLLNGRFSDFFYRLILLLTTYLGDGIYRYLRPLLGIRKQYDCAIAYRVGEPNKIVSLAVNAKKKICWWHNGECNYSVQGIQQIDRLWNNMCCLVSVSEGCKQMIRDKFVFDKEIHVIPNIIDVNAIVQLAGNQNPYPDGKDIKVVTLGRLCWEKHMEDVPLIAKKLLEHGYYDFKWYIIGDGAKKDEIDERIKELDLSDHVIMLGRKDNPYPYLKYADVMMHTSYVEAHCLTLLEAMALKTPCVATKTVIPQDFTIDAQNCLLAEQNINHQFECLCRLMYGDIDKVEMIKHAYDMVNQLYTSSAITQEFDKLLS